MSPKVAKTFLFLTALLTPSTSWAAVADPPQSYDDLFGLTGTEGLKLDTTPPVAEMVPAQSSTELFRLILNTILGFVGMLAMIMIVAAGFMYITAQGDDAKTEKGKKMLIAAIIGMIVIIASYTIVASVLSLGSASQGGLWNWMSNLL